MVIQIASASMRAHRSRSASAERQFWPRGNRIVARWPPLDSVQGVCEANKRVLSDAKADDSVVDPIFLPFQEPALAVGE